MSTPATFGHMNEAGREIMAQPELHSCQLCKGATVDYVVIDEAVDMPDGIDDALLPG